MRVRNGFKELTLLEARWVTHGKWHRNLPWWHRAFVFLAAPMHHIYRRLTGDLPFDPDAADQIMSVRVPDGPPRNYESAYWTCPACRTVIDGYADAMWCKACKEKQP